MAHQFNALIRALPALALWSCAGAAMAANPLGFAVAAAPSMFVLAVAQADAGSVDGKPLKVEAPPPPRQEAPAPDAGRSPPAVAQSAPQDRADEQKVALR